MELFVFVIVIAFIMTIMFSKGKMAATKPLGWFSLVASFIATQISSSYLLYTAEFAYTDGLSAILYPLGTSLGLLALGLGVGSKIHRLKLAGISDVFEKYYHSGTLKKMSSALLLASLLGLLIAQATALKDLLSAMGVASESIFITVWMAIVFFTVQGAIRSAAWTEILQVLFVLGVLGALYFFSPVSSSKELSFFQGMGQEAFGKINAISYLLMPCLFVFLEIETIESIPLKVHSKRKVWTACLVSCLLLCILSLVPIYCGIASNPENRITSGEMLPMIGNAEHSLLATCCTALLLIAFVYSSSSLLQSLMTQLKELFTHPRTREPAFQLSWKWTLGLGVAALICSYLSKGVGCLVLDSYELVVVSLVVPLIQAAFSRSTKQISKLGAALSMALGATSFLFCRLLNVTFLPELISLALSWIGFFIGKTVSRKKRRSQVNA